jgi:hypothetical protein
MKKNLLILSLSLLSTSTLFAQDEASPEPVIKEQKIRFGAFIAPTLSWMRPANTKSNDGAYTVSNNGSKVGFTWGIMLDYWFADNYAISTGLQVNGSGGNIRSNRIDQNTITSNTVYNTDFNYSLQYLELPINLKLKTSPLSNGVNFFGQAGVTPGFNISKKASYDVIATDNSNNITTYAEDKAKISGTLSVAPVMLQLNIGAGAQYPFSDRLTAYAGIFFNNGFAPDVTNPAKYSFTYPGSFSDGNIRLNNFALRLGLFF